MSISQDKKAVVIDKPSLEYICSCIKLLQSVPELLNDLTPSQKTVYSSYKVTELINALGENLQTYVNTSLGALTHLKKEIVQTVPTVDTAQENTIYLLKNDEDGGYSQYLLINGVVENLGSTTAINNTYTKDETEAKFALLSTLNDLIATVGGLNELKTNTKESIVKAINELNDRNYLEVIEITDKSVLDYAKTFDILTHNYFYANNCVDLPNNEHYGYCSVDVSQDPLYRDITFYSPTDGRIYVNTIGANADGSDFGTWSGWHKHLTNDDIVDTINSSSTDNQIPSAKGVYNSCIKDKNIKTYTNLSQLGLTYPITVGEIFNAMPANSMARLMADTNSVITDCPLTNGILIIDKCYMSKFSIEFKVSASGETAINTLYIGQLKGADGSGLIWRRVCTTSVADTSLKRLKNSSDINSDADITYIVKNGMCTVSANTVSSTKMSTGNITLTTGLPIPINPSCWYSLCTNSNATNAPVQNLLVRIDASGNLISYIGTNNSNYFGTFSYLVKES